MFKDLAKFLVPLFVGGVTFFLFMTAFHPDGVFGLVDEEIMMAAVALAVILTVVTFIVLKNLLRKPKI